MRDLPKIRAMRREMVVILAPLIPFIVIINDGNDKYAASLAQSAWVGWVTNGLAGRVVVGFTEHN